MKSVFLTGGARAATLKYILDRGEEVTALLVPKLSNKNRRFEEAILVAVDYGLPVIPVTKKTLKSSIVNLGVDCLISCGFPFLLDQSVINVVQHAINVHPTLLPKYRGYRSGAYILINGEEKTGVTVHLITEDMDKGDIIVQKEVSLSKFDTPRSMYRKVQMVEGQALLEALGLLKSGECEPIKQKEGEASEYTHLRTPEDSEINPTKPLVDLFNEIRACDPDDYPAFFYLDGEKVYIKLWRSSKLASEEDMI